MLLCRCVLLCTHLRDQEELVRTCVYRERRKMEEKGANVRRKSEKRKQPRARREKVLNYRKWPRRPCRNSMNCVTYRNVIRTSPGGADAHMRTHDGEIEVPTLEPSHRRVKQGRTTVKIARCVGNPEKGLRNGMERIGGGGKSMRTIV